MKHLLVIWLTVFFSIQLQASKDVPFGLFKDLGGPFEEAPYPHLSPLLGLDLDPIKGQRRHGHMGRNKSKFTRPTGRCVDPFLRPQDAMASVLERLVPSHIGFVINKSNADKVNHWLKPRCIALIFNAIYVDHILEQPETDAVQKLAAAMQPEFTENYLRQQENRARHHGTRLKPIVYSIESLQFAGLLLEAWRDNWGQKAALNGYTPNVLEHALLVYMWQKMTKKSDLEPFYLTLSDTLLKREKANQIIWSGELSRYTYADYMELKQRQGPYTIEQYWLRKLGYKVFEEPLPPVLEYSMSYILSDGKQKGFSNCGDIMLLTWMMHFMAKPNWDAVEGAPVPIFDIQILEGLRQKGFKVSNSFIEFFGIVCPRYAYAYDQEVWNRWSTLISHLNKPDDLEPVHYMHPTPTEGTHGIGAGIDNILTVLGKLCLPPEWNSQLYTHFDRSAHRLDLFCQAFSPCYLLRPEGDNWNWKVIRKGQSVPINDRDIGDPKDVCILLLLGNKPILELNCTPKHFEAIAASSSGFRAPIEEADKFYIPDDMTHERFPYYFYTENMDSISGKLTALNRAAWYVKRFNSQAFDHVIERWMDHSGTYFAGYSDEHTNRKLIEILYQRAEWSVDRIIAIGSSQLTAMLLTVLGPPLIEQVLLQDILAYRRQGSPAASSWQSHVRLLSYLIRNADHHKLSKLSQVGFVLDDYIFCVSGSSLLHMLAWGGKVDAMEFLVRNVQNPNLPDLSGNTPLHYAVRNHYAVVEILLRHGGDLSVTNQDGELPLHLAIKYKLPLNTILTMAQQMDNQLLSTITKKCQTPLGLALERILLDTNEQPDLVEYLVSQGAFLEPDFWKKNPLAYCQLHNRLQKETYQSLRSIQ